MLYTESADPIGGLKRCTYPTVRCASCSTRFRRWQDRWRNDNRGLGERDREKFRGGDGG